MVGIVIIWRVESRRLSECTSVVRERSKRLFQSHAQKTNIIIRLFFSPPSTVLENCTMPQTAHKIGQSLWDDELNVFLIQLFRYRHPGSLLFCPDCGTLLSLPADGEYQVACEQCGRKEPASCEPTYFLLSIDEPLNSQSMTAYENIEVVTRSHPDAFPSPLRQKGKTQTKVHDPNEALLKVCQTHNFSQNHPSIIALDR